MYNGVCELFLFSVKYIFDLSDTFQYTEASRSYPLIKEAAVYLPALTERCLFFVLQIISAYSLCLYRVSHELRSLLRENVPYVKIYRYNPKHLCPNLNGYGDNGQRKVLTSCISAYCTSTAVSRIDLDRAMQ